VPSAKTRAFSLLQWSSWKTNCPANEASSAPLTVFLPSCVSLASLSCPSLSSPNTLVNYRNRSQLVLSPGASRTSQLRSPSPDGLSSYAVAYFHSYSRNRWLIASPQKTPIQDTSKGTWSESNAINVGATGNPSTTDNPSSITGNPSITGDPGITDTSGTNRIPIIIRIVGIGPSLPPRSLPLKYTDVAARCNAPSCLNRRRPRPHRRFAPHARLPTPTPCAQCISTEPGRPTDSYTSVRTGTKSSRPCRPSGTAGHRRPWTTGSVLPLTVAVSAAATRNSAAVLLSCCSAARRATHPWRSSTILRRRLLFLCTGRWPVLLPAFAIPSAWL
jgi:hypothetical protein